MFRLGVRRGIDHWAGSSPPLLRALRRRCCAGELKRCRYTGILTPHPRSLEATPEKPAPVNWDGYKAKVTSTSYVDYLKTQYDALKFEYPADTLSADIAKKEKETVRPACC